MPASTEEAKLSVVNFSVPYKTAWGWRALVQLIPFAGGALDTLLSGIGATYERRRIEHNFQVLSDRLNKGETRIQAHVVKPSEPLYDLVVRVLDGVRRSRSR